MPTLNTMPQFGCQTAPKFGVTIQFKDRQGQDIKAPQPARAAMNKLDKSVVFAPQEKSAFDMFGNADGDYLTITQQPTGSYKGELYVGGIRKSEELHGANAENEDAWENFLFTLHGIGTELEEIADSFREGF